MPKYSKNRDNRVVGYSMFFKSNTPSSLRTQVGVNIMKKENDRKLTKTQRQRTNKKNTKFASMTTPDWYGLLHPDPSPFDGKKYDFAPSADMMLFDNIPDGFVHWMDKEKKIFSCCVIPEKMLQHQIHPKQTSEVVAALNVLQVTEKHCKRGATQTGVSETNSKYAVFHNKVKQGRGFSLSDVNRKNPEAANILQRFANRLGHLASMVIPSTLLRGMALVSAITKLDKIPGMGNLFAAALASTKNYNAPAHVDNDFFLSIHQLLVDGRDYKDDIVQYFCFPSCGYAVGLRPGYVLLFNPHVHHCLSRKSDKYSDQDVHVTTAYLKTSHVSKNDTTAHLSSEEMLHLDIKMDC